MDFKYHAFGLNIQSEIELPELLVRDFEQSDVSIKRGEVPLTLDDRKEAFTGFSLAPGKMLLRFQNVGNFYVEDGTQVIVDQLDTGNDKDIRLFILGSCFGALLHQRKFLVLHASAFVHDNEVVVISGESGAGKSSICNALRLEGYKVITDDVCAVRVENDQIVAMPGFPRSKLWDDSLAKLEIDNSDSLRVRESLEKFSINISAEFDERILKIKRMYVIYPYRGDQIELKDVSGADGMDALINMTYRHYFLDGMKLKASHFISASKFCMDVSIRQIKRPIQSKIQDIAKIIEKDLES